MNINVNNKEGKHDCFNAKLSYYILKKCRFMSGMIFFLYSHIYFQINQTFDQKLLYEDKVIQSMFIYDIVG